MLQNNLYGSGSMFKWTREYLLKVLTSGKNPVLTDPLLVSAFQKINRQDFLPLQFRDLAYNDQEIDIGYNEKLNKPTVVAQMISLVKPKYGGKYLDIGTGTGYTAAMFSYVAGDTGHVYSVERVQWLWYMARDNIKKYPELKNIEIGYRDGMEGLVTQAPFDGIHIGFAMETVPEKLKMQLKTNGARLVYPGTDLNLHVIERNGIDDFVEEIVPGFILDSGKVGIA